MGPCLSRPRFAKFSLIAIIELISLSTKEQNSAPFDNDSIPKAPDPAKRSKT
ncbi:MAG: hypothetical protein CM15mP109_15850 [Candidatus Dadabacteria bacterium]|nr:MAG: hypothetical protein CM15mP109_15850 [Candidatus Dadabacteria bacterium]